MVLIIHQQVGRLDIAVQNALLMGVLDGIRQVPSQATDLPPKPGPPRLVRSVRGRIRVALGTLFSQHLIEWPAPNQLHGVIVVPVVFSQIQDRHDVRMMETGRGAGLTQEPGARCTVGATIGDEDL